MVVLIFILGNLISGSISIRQAIHHTENNIRASLLPMAFISQDWVNYRLPWEEQGESLEREKLPQMERLDLEVLNGIGDLPYVKAYDLSI